MNNFQVKELENNRNNKVAIVDDLSPKHSILKEITEMDNNINNLSNIYKNYDSILNDVITKSKNERNESKEDQETNYESSRIYSNNQNKSDKLSQGINSQEIEIEINTKVKKAQINNKSTNISNNSNNNIKELQSIKDNSDLSDLSTIVKSIETPIIIKSKPHLNKKVYDSDFVYNEDDDFNDDVQFYEKNKQKSKIERKSWKKAPDFSNIEIPPKYSKNNEQSSKNDYVANPETIFSYRNNPIASLKSKR